MGYFDETLKGFLLFLIASPHEDGWKECGLDRKCQNPLTPKTLPTLDVDASAKTCPYNLLSVHLHNLRARRQNSILTWPV
jgi:hypothetical protein